MKYFITTFGCQMNVHESEKLAGVLEKLGYSESERKEDADIIIFNTCAIREGAEDRAVGNVGALKTLKKQHPEKIICICGCMTQKKPTALYLQKTFPFVDLIFGTKNLDKFENYIKEIVEQKNKKFNENNEKIEKKSLKKLKNFKICEIIDDDKVVEGLPIYRTSGKNAWVNIIYGCNNFCSYCVVPYVRGRERSRKKEDILTEIKNLIAENKYETITLLGQNVNSYGKDLYDEYGFANLLADICKIDGDFKLGFMTSHPKDITDEVIDQIVNQPKILKELHLPVQSGSNKILKAMNRKYTVESYLKIIEKLKDKLPCIRLSTDIIVGFPGETDEDFKLTCELVKKVKFENIFAFIYSIRPGTVAEKMDNQIDFETKNKRVNDLLALEKQLIKK